MARVKRVWVRLSIRMETALDLLAEQRELSPATVAYELLRQSLDRTIQSAECQRRIGKRMVELNRREWINEQNITAEELKTWNAATTNAAGE